MYQRCQQLLVTIAILTALTLPSRGRAQAPQGTLSATAHAVALEGRAHRMVDDVTQWRAAARLMEQAAALRRTGDPLGVADLIFAGSVYYYSRTLALARALYEQAAERALADGDVDVAARTFLLAALVANEQRDPGALQLKERAERLAGSPLLTDGQRRLILGQFRAQIQVAREH